MGMAGPAATNKNDFTESFLAASNLSDKEQLHCKFCMKKKKRKKSLLRKLTMTMNKDSGKNEPCAVKDYPVTYSACCFELLCHPTHSTRKKEINKGVE